MGSACSCFTQTSRNRRQKAATKKPLVDEDSSDTASANGQADQFDDTAVSLTRVRSVANPLVERRTSYVPPAVPPVLKNDVDGAKLKTRTSISPANENGHALKSRTSISPAAPEESRPNNPRRTSSNELNPVVVASNSQSQVKPRPSITNNNTNAIPTIVKPHVKRNANLNLSDCTDKLVPVLKGKSLLDEIEEDIYIRGYVNKRGHTVKSWKRRYVVLDVSEIRYYVSDAAAPPYGYDLKGQLNIAFASIVQSIEKDTGKEIVEVIPPDHIDHGLYLCFQDNKEKNKWLIALTTAIRKVSMKQVMDTMNSTDLSVISRRDGWFQSEKIQYESILSRCYFKNTTKDNRTTFRMKKYSYHPDGKPNIVLTDVMFYSTLFHEFNSNSTEEEIIRNFSECSFDCLGIKWNIASNATNTPWMNKISFNDITDIVMGVMGSDVSVLSIVIGNCSYSMEFSPENQIPYCIDSFNEFADTLAYIIKYRDLSRQCNSMKKRVYSKGMNRVPIVSAFVSIYCVILVCTYNMHMYIYRILQWI